MVERLQLGNIPEMVEIWNNNAGYLTSDGKTHTVESLTDWHKGQSISKHFIYGFFKAVESENGKQTLRELMGFCITKEDPDISWVKMFAIKDSFQRKGVGSEALKEIESKLLQKRIQCEVKESNTMGLNFFLNQGYREIDFDGEYREFMLEKKRFADV